ncbi:MAG TPA: hypothetical protein VG248_12895 [Caulobacteraceae bacterium]|jgi:hypothetical protein|nr:hypothetical protein [Caulobacteraceae bacterium]
MPAFLRAAWVSLVVAVIGAWTSPAGAHTFDITYRSWGRAAATAGNFRPASGYEIRFEGCWAKHSDEAICGFTVRAQRRLTITNLRNASHAGAADGAVKRTCCMFVQGDNRGWPIVATAEPGGAGVLREALTPSRPRAVMLRVPNYGAGGPLASITFSCGDGDAGVTFPAKVVELP